MNDVVARCGEDVAQICEGVLDTLLPSEETFAVLLELVEERIGAALAGRDTAPPACRKGCAACCTVNVGALAVEGAAVAAYLRRKVGPDQASSSALRLLEFHEQVRWLDDGERIRSRLTCPLLDERGACSIHPARPLACRSVTSLDPRACHRAVAERADEDGAGAVPMDLFQRAIYEEALGALTRALAKRGLDARRRDVSGMAGAFLADEHLARAFGVGARLPLE